FSEHLACANCGLSFDKLAPRNFSFNTPYGACETCHGLGTRLEVDPELVIDEEKPLVDGGIRPWATGSQSTYYQQLLRALGEELGFDTDATFEDLTAVQKRGVLYGLGRGRKIQVRYTNRYGRQRVYRAAFEGVISQLLRRHAET